MTRSLPSKSLILYADDDQDDLELVREIFQEYGAVLELRTFGNGEELLGHIAGLDPLEPQPCLIILDINMPVLDGKETLRRLRCLDGYSAVPAVLFSTSTLPHEAVFARKYDAGFITKPLYANQVHELVDEMLAWCHDEVREKVKRFRGR